VGSRTGGIPDVVQEGLTGSLVEPGDAGALAHALIEVLTGPEDAEAMGRRGRAAAGDWLLTPEEFAARYARLFRELAP
jgi:starch synthase